MKWSPVCTSVMKENNLFVNARRPHGTIEPVNTTEPESLLQGTSLGTLFWYILMNLSEGSEFH